MLNLIPEKVDFKISTTDISVVYTERSHTQLELDILKIENYLNRDKYTSVSVLFETVAEVRCCSLNFHEFYFRSHEIFNLNEGGNDLEFWKQNGYHPDSGFYQVDKSQWLKEVQSKYDPQNNLGLKHFLILGNDIYVEILADGYTIQ